MDFVYHIIDFQRLSFTDIYNDQIYFLFLFSEIYIFPLSFRIFISNSIFRIGNNQLNFSKTNPECLRCSQIWLASAAKKGGNYRAFTYDALLSLVSIHNQRSPHHRLTLRRGGKKKGNGDMPGKAVGQKENVERDAAMRERSFRKIRWILCAELF